LAPVTDLATLLRTLHPVLNSGVYVFATASTSYELPADAIVASIREPEGLSVVVEESVAKRAGLSPLFRCAWLTLAVNSDLHAVGLSAAFASALAKAGISCNIVAGVNHDHIFVPVEQANSALKILRALQAT
jgi:uncharacterized protein